MLAAVVEPGSRLVVRRGSVVIVKKSGEKITLPPDIEMVVLVTGRCSVSGQALRALLERGVTLAVLGPRGDVLGFLQPSVPNKTAATRLAQMARVLRGEGMVVAKWLVYAKIMGQANNLKYLAKALREPWLRDKGYEIDSVAAALYEKEPSELDARKLMEAEAYAARLYWSTLSTLLPEGLGFRGRCPECRDPVNAALNLAYAILYSVARRALTLAGLDPYIGVLHTMKSGRESLVYDYSEPYKPGIDRVLFAKPRRLGELRVNENGLLDTESRRTVVEAATEALERLYPHRGRRKPLKRIIEVEAWALASWFRSGGEYRAWHLPVR